MLACLALLSLTIASSTKFPIWSQSFSSEFSVFWMVCWIVFSMSLHTSSIWFTQRTGLLGLGT